MLPCWLSSPVLSRGVTAVMSVRAISMASASSRTVLMPNQVLTKARSSATSNTAATATATRTSIMTKPRLDLRLTTAGGHDVDKAGEPVDADTPIQFAFPDMHDGAAGAAV